MNKIKELVSDFDREEKLFNNMKKLIKEINSSLDKQLKEYKGELIMKTKLQRELMEIAEEILYYGVPDILLSRFERLAIKRYEEIKKKKRRSLK